MFRGVDAMFVGPNDLLSSMHKTPNMDSEDPEFLMALQRVRETAARCGIASGIHVANAEAARRRTAEGWQFIAVSSELGFMQNGASGGGTSCHRRGSQPDWRNRPLLKQ